VVLNALVFGRLQTPVSPENLPQLSLSMSAISLYLRWISLLLQTIDQFVSFCTSTIMNASADTTFENPSEWVKFLSEGLLAAARMFEAHRRLLPPDFAIDALTDTLQITATVSTTLAEATFMASRDPSAIPALESAFSQFRELHDSNLALVNSISQRVEAQFEPLWPSSAHSGWGAYAREFTANAAFFGLLGVFIGMFFPLELPELMGSLESFTDLVFDCIAPVLQLMRLRGITAPEGLSLQTHLAVSLAIAISAVDVAFHKLSPVQQAGFQQPLQNLREILSRAVSAFAEKCDLVLRGMAVYLSIFTAPSEMCTALMEVIPELMSDASSARESFREGHDRLCAHFATLSAMLSDAGTDSATRQHLLPISEAYHTFMHFFGQWIDSPPDHVLSASCIGAASRLFLEVTAVNIQPSCSASLQQILFFLIHNLMHVYMENRRALLVGVHRARAAAVNLPPARRALLQDALARFQAAFQAANDAVAMPYNIGRLGPVIASMHALERVQALSDVVYSLAAPYEPPFAAHFLEILRNFAKSTSLIIDAFRRFVPITIYALLRTLMSCATRLIRLDEPDLPLDIAGAKAELVKKGVTDTIPTLPPLILFDERLMAERWTSIVLLVGPITVLMACVQRASAEPSSGTFRNAISDFSAVQELLGALQQLVAAQTGTKTALPANLFAVLRHNALTGFRDAVQNPSEHCVALLESFLSLRSILAYEENSTDMISQANALITQLETAVGEKNDFPKSELLAFASAINDNPPDDIPPTIAELPVSVRRRLADEIAREISSLSIDDLKELARAGDVVAQFDLARRYQTGWTVPFDGTLAAQYFKKASEQGHRQALAMYGLFFEHGWGMQKDVEQALQCYRKAADSHDPLGQYCLALALRSGNGVTRDTNAALSLFSEAAGCGHELARHAFLALSDSLRARLASISRSEVRRLADSGDMEAQLHFARLCFSGNSVREDKQLAAAYRKKAGDQGHPQGLNDYGYDLKNGLGVPQDEAAAVACYRRAAEHRFALSEYNYALALMSGKGTHKDRPAAALFFKLAYIHGNARGYPQLLELNEKLPVRFRSFDLSSLRSLADAGDAGAQYEMARRFQSGRSTPRNIPLSVRYCKLAADRGHSGAQVWLGRRFDEGDGVPIDKWAAVRYYKLAAVNCDSEGQFRLGLALRSGVGIERDLESALDLFLNAAAQGHFHAGVLGNELRAALEYWTLAAELGNAEAMGKLGALLARGEEFKQDLEAAFRWFKMGADLGNRQCQWEVGRALENGNGVKEDRQAALKFYKMAGDGALDASVPAMSWARRDFMRLIEAIRKEEAAKKLGSEGDRTEEPN
jgi:TPR repeat protein